MIDFISFVNSKDIREHLRKTDYRLTPLEAAWLIYQNREVTLGEKHAAWNELIETMPDCVIPERKDCRFRSSLHQFLREYMAFQDELIRIFQDTEDAYYRCYIFDKPNVRAGEQLLGLFSSPKEAKDAVTELQLADDGFIIIREKMNNPVGSLGVVYSYYMEPVRIEAEFLNCSEDKQKLYLESFDGMWFDFPTPFKKGDILCNPSANDERRYGPFVYLGKNKDSAGAAERVRTSQNGGYYEMTVEGYYPMPNGKLQRGSMYNYMDCELYSAELEGGQRVLGILQGLMRGSLEIDRFINTYIYLITEADFKKRFDDDFAYEKALLTSLQNENNGEKQK